MSLFRAFQKVCAPLLLVSAAFAADQRGQVLYGGFPVPGAVITATHAGTTATAVTDEQGFYTLVNLADGAWSVKVSKPAFATVTQEVNVSAAAADAAKFELKLLPLAEIHAQPADQPIAPVVTASATPAVTKKGDGKEEAAAPAATQEAKNNDGLLINGSVNNGASSPFAQFAAFGNRRNHRALYNGSVGAIFGNAVFDAKPYSISGLNVDKPGYYRFTGLATLGGPLRIPHLITRVVNAPTFFVAYQWSRNRNATSYSALMPTQAQRNGDLSAVTTPIINPVTGAPYANNQVPVSPQAAALLQYYPLPNLAGSSRYNYQTTLLNTSHADALQARVDKTIDRKNQVYGSFNFQSLRGSSNTVFHFVDRTKNVGLAGGANWSHRINGRWSFNVGYKFARQTQRTTAYFQNGVNVSGNAGITGNNQDPFNYGPPTLSFASGIAGLTDSIPAFNRNQTQTATGAVQWNRGRHNVTFGGEYRRQQYNYFTQQNPRGAFAFTGTATGNDLAGFLVGVPDTSQLATGNPDKYFRQNQITAYATDDFRMTPTFTVNAGIRWEYGAPITELKDRMVNLDILPDFSAVSQVLASSPTGRLTGQHYPDSLVRPFRKGFQPRVGIAWRPIPASSVVVRAGYGIYFDTSVYQTTALKMAQQAPLSTSLSVQRSSTCPITLANGFQNCAGITSNTFAVDPRFRGGYVQDWQLAVQRDLPFSLQLTATYNGLKGTHSAQQFLPNTYAYGGTDLCPSCPNGYTYLTSGGNSTRNAGQVQLRRRLHSGFTATVDYTYANAIDNASFLGGQNASSGTGTTSQNPFAVAAPTTTNDTTIVQNWRDLRAERGGSAFNQRHTLALTAQYTSGMGMHGGALMNGKSGTLLKEWTLLGQIVANSGQPQTPIYPVATPGTGVTGNLRAQLTGADVYAAPAGLHLNPAAYTTPVAGSFGNAGRNSITGPGQFRLNASLSRTFRVKGDMNLDIRADVTNAMNHVAFTRWNTTLTSTQFGLPAAANDMRSVQFTSRLRF